MRRSLTLAAVVAALAVPASAFAASQTVAGKGDIEKMKVTNGQDAVTVALFGLEKKCGGTRQANVTISWGQSGYVYDGICPSGEWGEGLFYFADLGDRGTKVGKQTTCGKLVTRVSDGAFRLKVPRSCLRKADDQIRVKAVGQNFGTLTGGTAGPTKRLARG